MMAVRVIPADYISQLLAYTVYDKMDDGTYTGRIPQCGGVVAFGANLRECEDELHSTLEDWILIGLKLGHLLPAIAKINLNKDLTLYGLDQGVGSWVSLASRTLKPVSPLPGMRCNRNPYYPIDRWQNRACCPDDVPPSETTDAFQGSARAIVELLVSALPVWQDAQKLVGRRENG